MEHVRCCGRAFKSDLCTPPSHSECVISPCSNLPMSQQYLTLYVAAVKRRATGGGLCHAEWLCHQKLWVSCSNPGDSFFHLEDVDAKGMVQMWQDQSWCKEDKQFARHNLSVSFVGVTTETLCDIAKKGGCYNCLQKVSRAEVCFNSLRDRLRICALRTMDRPQPPFHPEALQPRQLRALRRRQIPPRT